MKKSIKISEKIVEKYLVKCVKRRGGWAIKLTSSGNWGLPDRLCLLPGGKIVFVELKTTGRKPSDRQRRVMNTLKQLGFITVVIDGVNKVDAFLEYVDSLTFSFKGVSRDAP